MKLSMPSARSLAFAGALIFMGTGLTHAQPVGGQSPQGQNRSVIGQPPLGQNSSIIGQPPGGQSGTRPIQPNYPNTGSAIGSDPVKDKLNQTNREAADLDRDGRISPEEAARMPGIPASR
ncbi:hypothetical protein C8R32_102183 [Nitrosospira sp. Nsp5]|uniref:EF-hand domain-containing protein n=1 Tax=Nitrosospira multiformis TaxID=1231 RepID=A0ABY0TQF5_9PROT|nr:MULTISPECIES: hypothetical protein [Nitrosospira]PTR10094.1 hypothetical protein C8R32_102183 [Nitrosospira sp. Nsp5]SDQ97576.1 hypothetical protein SAMN05216402_3075 [Nitrosospira multiformis]